MEILFDNQDYDRYKREMVECGMYKEEEITDENLYDFIQDMLSETLREIYDICRDSKILATGIKQSWNGFKEGFEVYDNIDNAIYTIAKDCEYYKFYVEDSDLYFSCSHYDGRHNVCLKILTSKGEEIYEDYCCHNLELEYDELKKLLILNSKKIYESKN